MTNEEWTTKRILMTNEEKEQELEVIRELLRKEFPEGSLVRHKVDGRKMVVLGYQLFLPSLDHAFVSCQYVATGKEGKDYDGTGFNRFSLELIKEEKSAWIPVEERLPEFETTVLITEVDNRSNRLFTTCGEYMKGGYWFADQEQIEVVAWMPLPHPYGRLTQEEYDSIGNDLRTKNFVENPDFPDGIKTKI